MRIVLRRLLILALSLLLLQIASDAWSQAKTAKLSGLAYVDFRGKPRFKVGDWVKYHFTSKSDDGRSEDYDMTILISGRETFWGDDGFWIETWAGGRTLQPQVTSFLMSYSAFGDTAWLQHLQHYQRKTGSNDGRGGFLEELTRRVLSGKAIGGDRPLLTVLTDTLGTDTVRVAPGLFRCQKVERKAGLGSVEEHGDSTVRLENWDRRTLYLSTKVPVTSLVREVDERWITRKTWKVGKSADAVQNYKMRGTGSLDLVAWGSGGLEPKATPLHARRAGPPPAESRTGKPPARKRS